jgi:type IV secretion system protein VirB9
VSRILRTIRFANQNALSAPRASEFINAALVYDFEPNRLYRVDASPQFLTTIALRPGEHLVSKAAGDTVRWIVGETTQGTGDTAQTLIMIKPLRGDLKTNLVVSTDQRSYFIEVVSHEAPTYTNIISWNYPLDPSAIVLPARHALATTAPLRHEQSTQAIIPVERLDFSYTIDHPRQKRAPDWQPLRVFDDGARTYIQFPTAAAASDLPPLFLLGGHGEAELVNYRVVDRYYIVDRLMDAAELRFGQSPQSIVRITRTGDRG